MVKDRSLDSSIAIPACSFAEFVGIKLVAQLSVGTGKNHLSHAMFDWCVRPFDVVIVLYLAILDLPYRVLQGPVVACIVLTFVAVEV